MPGHGPEQPVACQHIIAQRKLLAVPGAHILGDEEDLRRLEIAKAVHHIVFDFILLGVYRFHNHASISMFFFQRNRHFSLAAVPIDAECHAVAGGVGIELGIQCIHIRHGTAVGGENNVTDA